MIFPLNTHIDYQTSVKPLRFTEIAIVETTSLAIEIEFRWYPIIIKRRDLFRILF